jgi:Zn-finger nucleic acid-binding protein
MNRINFAEYSGVVVDVCREHGTWFDAHELQRIVHFLRDGGMSKVRDRQQRELAAARRKLESARTHASPGVDAMLDHGERDLLPDLLKIAGALFRHRR